MQRTLWVLICGVAADYTCVTTATRPRPDKPRIDYSRFSHVTEQHRAACSSCHTFPSKNWKQVRKGDDAFPDVTEYPEHQACLSCHRQQFFARERPVPRICSNCHMKATPIDTSRYPFPSLGEAFFQRQKRETLFPTSVCFFHTISMPKRIVPIVIKLISHRKSRMMSL